MITFLVHFDPYGSVSELENLTAKLKAQYPTFKQQQVFRVDSADRLKLLFFEALKHAEKDKQPILFSSFKALSEARLLEHLLAHGQAYFFLDYPSFEVDQLQTIIHHIDYEQRFRSARVRRLRAGKRKLGNPGILNSEVQDAAAVARKDAPLRNELNRLARRKIVELRKLELSFNEIARQLNELGFKTKNGKEFRAKTVTRLYQQHEELLRRFDSKKDLESADRSLEENQDLKKQWKLKSPVPSENCIDYKLVFSFGKPLEEGLNLTIESLKSESLLDVDIEAGAVGYEVELPRYKFPIGRYYWILKSEGLRAPSLEQDFLIGGELLPG